RAGEGNRRRGPWASHLPHHRRSPRRPDLGRKPPGRRRDVLLHPAASRDAPDGRAGNGGCVTSAGHLILIVEDEPQIRHFLRTTLTAEGYRVIEAENGERGVLEAATHKPDLVMVDLGLPDIDGVEVVKRI